MPRVVSAPDVLQTAIPGLYRIALPTPFPVGPVNVYLAEGEPLTLIDCGVGNDETREALAAALATLGYGIRDIERILITHHHTDHLGLAGDLARESRAEIWTHLHTVRWLERPRETRSTLRRFTDTLFQQSGVPEKTIEQMNLVSRYLESLTRPARVSMTVEDGEWVELAGLCWVVYHTPGHAGDLICLYQPESRVLLSSDHLLRDISSNPLIEAPPHTDDERPKRLLDYMRELSRIARLDIDVAYGGHGEPARDVTTLINSRLDLHYRRAEKLLELFEDQPRTLYELAKLMFPRAHESEMYLVLSEVLGHLDLLARDGLLTGELRDDRFYWCPVAHCLKATPA